VTSPLQTRGAFREEALWQRVCAVCQRPGPYHAHHTIHEQELARRNWPTWDERNALRICNEGVENCHSRHHWKVRPIRTVELLDMNVALAFEVMGLYGADWLRRYYDDMTEPDPRISQLQSGVQ
jgi:hypothetical protein